MKKAAVIIVILILGSWLWYANALKPVHTNDTTGKVIQIPTGSSVRSIASILQEKGIVRSAMAFKLYARLHGIQSDLKAGGYVLKPSMSVTDVIDVLRRGFSEQALITIPEGYTVKDIDALMASKGLSKPGDIIACAQTCDFSGFKFLPPASSKQAPRGGRLEGYLFPDTYFVIRDTFTPESFLIRLLGTFRQRVVDGLKADLAASPHSLSEVITMASLVEEESRGKDERPLVAGILWKRLAAKQGLYVDASNRYILDKPTATITEKDLQLDSPYNLRKYRGLPPGPITNPGLESITAALHPVESSYWYYLHDSKGVIHYAVTNDEQNENRAKYLR